MRYASLANRTLSRLDLMSSRGISSMSEALWSLERKLCSETVVGLELFVCLFVNWSTVFVKTVFKSSFCFSYVLFVCHSSTKKIGRVNGIPRSDAIATRHLRHQPTYTSTPFHHIQSSSSFCTTDPLFTTTSFDSANQNRNMKQHEVQADNVILKMFGL